MNQFLPIMLILFGHITIAAMIIGSFFIAMGVIYIVMVTKTNERLQLEKEKAGFKETIRPPE